MSRGTTLGAVLLAALAGAPLAGAVCTVPGTHATIRAAGDDPACSEIRLGAQLFVESVAFYRSVALTGQGPASTIVRGVLRAGVGADVTLAALRVESGCQPVLQALDGGTITGTGAEAVLQTTLECPNFFYFADDLEPGDARHWSRRSPP